MIINVPPKTLKASPLSDTPEVQMGVAGYYKFVLKNRDGSIAQVVDWFPNLITDLGMSRIVNYDGGITSWGAYLAIGSSATTPTFADTVMGAQLGTRTDVTTSTSAVVYDSYMYRRYTHRYIEGNGTGTIREVGYFSASTGGVMFSHALLVDGSGTPTSIVKDADQSLDVYYELRNYPKLSDSTGTFDLSGTAYNYTFRPLNLNPADIFGSANWTVNSIEKCSASFNNYSAYTGGGLGARTANAPTGTFLNPSLFYDTSHAANTYAYAKGSYYTDNQIQCGIDAWHGTITVVTFVTGNCQWQCLYSKVSGGGGIVKTNEDRLRLKIRLTVARHA